MSEARVSVSSWSLHRHLGRPSIYGVGQAIPGETHGKGEFSLLELPARIAAFGIHTLEICHFHLPSLDGGYLAEVRQAIEAAGVELWSLLVDDGDVIHPQHGERDQEWIAGWLKVGAALGTKCMRVIAGKQPFTEANLQLSLQRVGALAAAAEVHNIRLMTENWFDLLAAPTAVTQFLDGLNGRVGLCLDFGNWQGEGKYAGFVEIAPYAESCHAKGQFGADGRLDEADYKRCLDILQTAAFAGPYTLIYDSPNPASQWDGLAAEMEIMRPYLTSSSL